MYDNLQPCMQKNSFDITIRDSIRTKVSAIKFLGVLFDVNLTFKDHVNKVTTKISKYVGVMMRLLPVACRRNVQVTSAGVYFLVYSHLTYAFLEWGRSGSANAAKIER